MTDAAPPPGSTTTPSEPTTAVPDSPAAITQPVVRGFLVADHATLPPDGKIYIAGGFFTLLRFQSFPGILQTLGIAAAIEIPFRDIMSDHTLAVSLLGPNEEELPLRVEARFRTAPNFESQFGEPHLVPLAATVTSVEFRHPGRYQFVLTLDGTELARYALRATQTATAVLQH